MNLGNNIRWLRRRKKISQEVLAVELGVRPSSISKYENDKGTPSFEQLTKLTNFFNVSYDDLILKDLSREPAEGLPAQKEAAPSNITQLLSRLEGQLQEIEQRLAQVEDREIVEKLYELRDEMIKDNPKKARELGLL